MEDVNKELINDLLEEITVLQTRVERLKTEPLCDHHWNGSDRCYECYCTGCGKHIREAHNMASVPFAKDAYCYQCRKTPEEIAKEKAEAEERTKQKELETLRRLQEKYTTPVCKTCNDTKQTKQCEYTPPFETFMGRCPDCKIP